MDISMFIKSVYNKIPYKDKLDEITLEIINIIKNTCNQLSTSKKYVTHSEFYNAIQSNFSTKLLKNSFLKFFSQQKELTALKSSCQAHKNLEKKNEKNTAKSIKRRYFR